MKLTLIVSFVLSTAKAQFPILNAATAVPRSKVGLPVNGLEENQRPFDLPAGYTMTKITDRFILNASVAPGVYPAGFSNYDMITYAAPEYAEPGLYPNAGRYIFIPMETGAGGVLRYDVAYGTFLIYAAGNGGARNFNVSTFNVSNDNFLATDPCTFTPYNTLLWGEEVTGGRMFEVQRPFAATAAAAGVRWLSRIPAVSQEGIRFDKSLNLYFIDESNTGSIYKFVPLVPGNLAVGQSFVLRVTAYTGNATLNWDNALASPRVGPATWVPITDVVGNRITVADPFQYNSSISLGGRSAADEVGGTPYGRPEDIALSVDKDGNEVLYVPTTTENVVYTIVLLDATNAFVKTLCSRNTIDISTGLPVGSNFTSPDNMAIDAAGTVYVVEDQGPPVADIWQAVDVDNDGVAEYLARWLGMGVTGAEPTGLFFHPNNLDTAIVAVQHPSSVNDAVWEIKLGACAVTYRVWNARTQQAVATLVDGLVIAQPPCLVNIQAVATCGSAQTPITPPVVIRLATRAGVVVRTRTETLAPYFLFGDTNGRILDGAISAGTYRISSTVGGVATPSVLFTFGTCGPN